MTKKFKILILWADSKAANLGLRVLAEGNAVIANRAFGAENIEVDFQDFGPGDSNVSFGTKAIIRDLLSRNGPIKTKLRQYDLVIDSGAGDSFADIYGLKRLSFIFYAHAMLRRLRIPLVMGPQTIGPFQNSLARRFAQMSLKQAQLVLARDSISAEYAESIGARRVEKSTDVVFTLPVPDGEKRWDLLFNVSGLLWFGDEHVSSSQYRESCRRLVTILQGRGQRVALMAHVVNSPSGNDDVDAANELAGLLGNNQIEILVPETLLKARHYVSSARLVVGARMHACLNALSVGTPAVPWAYSRKFAPLLEDIGWDICFDLRDSFNVVERTLAVLETVDSEAVRFKMLNMQKALAPRIENAVFSLSNVV